MMICLKCHSGRVVSGKFVTCDGHPAEFWLDGARRPRLKLHRLSVDARKSKACLDCGFVWNSIEPKVLQSLVDAAARGSSLGPRMNGTVKACLICFSGRVVSGEYVCSKGSLTRFRPDGVRILKLVFQWILPATSKFTGCLDCGCVWNSIDLTVLRSFVKENCKSSVIEKYGLNQQ